MNSFEPLSADMARVIQQFLPAYRQRYKLSAEQASVCQSILQCQTEALGGEPVQCSACGYEQVLYHSCGNRHCPRCKQRASQQWEEKQLDALLPVRYYHLVFSATAPALLYLLHPCSRHCRMSLMAGVNCIPK